MVEIEFEGKKIIVLKGDITEMSVDAIVNPANSLLYMGGGVAGAIKRKGGEEIEREAVKQGPIKIGEAVITGAGKLKAKYVVHSPTMERPAMRTNTEKVRLSVRAALLVADKKGVNSVAFPGMGTGVGGVPVDDAAKVMIDEIKKNIRNLTSIREIYLVAFDDTLYNAFRRVLEQDW